MKGISVFPMSDTFLEAASTKDEFLGEQHDVYQTCKDINKLRLEFLKLPADPLFVLLEQSLEMTLARDSSKGSQK